MTHWKVLLISLAVAALGLGIACSDGDDEHDDTDGGADASLGDSFIEEDSGGEDDAGEPEASVTVDARSQADVACVPICATRECGDDGCGGDCPPGCESPLRCDQDRGNCVPMF